MDEKINWRRQIGQFRDPMMIGWWILFVLVITTVVFVRIRLLAIPLERDEGEYAYAGQLMLQGVPPYKFAYNMKFPGTYAAYALIMALFGQSVVAIHFGLLIVNLATVALVFAIALRFTNHVGAIVASGCYAVASLSPSVLGLATHAVHFVLLPALGGTLLLIDNRAPLRAQRIFWSGVLCGIAVLMKQPAIFFLLFNGCYLLYREMRERKNWPSKIQHAATFGLGAVLPVALTFLGLWIAGVFPKFWFWTVNYARAYGSIVPFKEGLLIGAQSTKKVLAPIWPICGLAALGIAGLVWNKRIRQNAVPIVLFFLGSGAALCSGLYFREHYYVFILPVLSILAGVAVGTSVEALSQWPRISQGAVIVVAAAALAQPLVSRSRLLFLLPADKACAEIYRGNLFKYSPQIAAYVREHTAPEDTIAVIGSDPEIYFYSGRRSATGYIYMYALMEEHRYVHTMQEEMKNEIEQARPKFLISISLSTSWFIGPWSDLSIIDWAVDYSSRNYHPVGYVNILAGGLTEYCLPCDKPIESRPLSAVIFERN